MPKPRQGRDGTLLAGSDLRDRLRLIDRPILVGVAGDSGAGKSTYMAGITRLLGEDVVATLSLDGYHTEDRARRRETGRVPLDPQINDLELAREHILAVRDGHTVTVPVYDHGTGTFTEPREFTPAPVVIVEGLHALYPEFTDLYDFTLFVDSARDVKWEWKRARDVHGRGYHPEDVEAEMRRREAAYKRWIDFQKTQAAVVIKIHHSELASLAVQSYHGELPPECYHIEVIVTPTATKLPPLNLSVDLNTMTQRDPLPFMLASVPSSYWGREVNVIHIDGVIPQANLNQLEREFLRLTGIPGETDEDEGGSNSTIKLTQLVVAWPFVGNVTALLDDRDAADPSERTATP